MYIQDVVAVVVQLFSHVWLFVTPWTAESRLSCPSLSTGVYSNSCSLSRLRHPTISSSVTLFFPALNLSQHQGPFQWVGSSHQEAKLIGASASAIVLPRNTQGWFPLGVTDLIYWASKGLLSLLRHHSSKGLILQHSAFFIVQFSHPYITTGKTIALVIWTFVSKVMYLLFNKLPRFAISFLPRSKCLLISWLPSPSTVILELKEIKSVSFHFFPSICHEVMGMDAMILAFFECWVLSQLFNSLLLHLSRCSLVSLHFQICSGVICITEVDISPSNFDSSLWLSSLAFHMAYSADKLNKQGDSIHPWLTTYPTLKFVLLS